MYKVQLLDGTPVAYLITVRRKNMLTMKAAFYAVFLF